MTLLGNSDIVVLTEHWLCPYSLLKLDDLQPDFAATAIADERLNPESDLTRGVAIIWRKSVCTMLRVTGLLQLG